MTWHRQPRSDSEGLSQGVGAFCLWMGTALTLAGALLDDSWASALGLGALVFAGVAWVWQALSFHGVRYSRRFSESRAYLGETVTLTLEIENRKALPLTWLEVADTVSGQLQVDGTDLIVDPASHLGTLHSYWNPGGYRTLRQRYTLRCTQRGFHAFGPARLTSGDGFGFFERRRLEPDIQHLIVYPRLYSALELGLPTLRPFGDQTSRRLLFEDPIQSAGVRDWSPHDSLRRIAWKATARHQKLLSRWHEPTKEPQVLIALNVATLEKHWEGVVQELLERTISAAASLAVLCERMRLPVGAMANAYWPGSDQMMRLKPSRSPEQLMRILEMLAAVTGYANRPLEEILLRAGTQLPWGATLLVVTAVAHDALLQAILELDRHGQQVVLFTLAERPPAAALPGITVYHLPHLVEDLMIPQEIVP